VTIGRRVFLAAGLSVVLVGISGALGAGAGLRTAGAQVKVLTFAYRSHAGTERRAYLVLPAWYGERNHPPIPLVISPHGRGVDGAYNLRFWGRLPARGSFAVISPDGQGRRLPLYSWGYAGQIADLARLPALARTAFPWLTIDPRRVYAVGDSMAVKRFSSSPPAATSGWRELWPSTPQPTWPPGIEPSSSPPASTPSRRWRESRSAGRPLSCRTPIGHGVPSTR
jgi:hypothetical protein